MLSTEQPVAGSLYGWPTIRSEQPLAAIQAFRGINQRACCSLFRLERTWLQGTTLKNSSPEAPLRSRVRRSLHHQLVADLAGDVAQGRRSVLPALRVAAHVCDAAQRGRSSRSFRDADATPGRCGGVQALQPGKAKHDAGSVGAVGPAG
jgi:hypothetical protein